MPALSLSESQGLNEHSASGGSGQPGLEHQRATAIVSAGGGDTAGSEAPVARILVEEAPEQGGRVEPGKAQPFDDAVQTHKGRAVRVG